MLNDLENACKSISFALKIEESGIMQKDYKSLQILSNCIFLDFDQIIKKCTNSQK